MHMTQNFTSNLTSMPLVRELECSTVEEYSIQRSGKLAKRFSILKQVVSLLHNGLLNGQSSVTRPLLSVQQDLVPFFQVCN